jgi:tRNA A37 threonylcarbamoyladenosine synthetase subunit TsaC/SUA5/YrdC
MGGQRFAAGIARPDGAVGLRCSSHPVAAALACAAEAAGLGPLTATSMNRSGEPPARCRAEVRSICESHAGPHVFEGWGDDAYAAQPSTVVDLTCTPARVLRWGGLDAAALAPFSDSIEIAHAIADRPRSTPDRQ